mmetsp:Transcript_21527/g.21167  ORF Transcript_21527/g.21167 Transcript_21527/m.21167 type:complete len:318 (+) Transcript_21527:1250-2203(+)
MEPNTTNRYRRSNVSNYEASARQTPHEAHSETQQRQDFLNYINISKDGSALRGATPHQNDSKKQSLYQGGFSKDDRQPEATAEFNHPRTVERPEKAEVLPERGNKAESITSSQEEHKKSTSTSKGLSSDTPCPDLDQDIAPEIAEFSLKSRTLNQSKPSVRHRYAHLEDEDDDSDEEQKVYYRGRGISKEMQETEIPEQYRLDKGKDLTPQMFEIQSLLGKGAFGKVYLVTKKDTGKPYAMKVLSKDQIIQNRITRYALSEKNVMSRVPHPFIVGLNYAFQTQEFLYLILDYCPGGNIGDLLDRVNNLEEEQAKMYT